MPEDLNLLDEEREPSPDSDETTHILKTYPPLINKLDINDFDMKQILSEERLAMRQDVIVYKFNFASSCQAASIILAILMLINSLIYLSFSLNSSPHPNWHSIFNWIIFIESGFLILFSGLTVHRRTLVLKQRKYNKYTDPDKLQLKFAFAHSITYFIAGICMFVLSLLISNVI